jgi:tetratricopeptide (TPR) repeat protein
MNTSNCLHEVWSLRARQALVSIRRAALALLLACGLLAWSHAMLPVYQASHYRWLGEQVDQKAKKVIGADILFELAATHDRFKAPHAFEAMQYLLRKRRFAEILTTYDRYAGEGLGMDALLVRAAALEQTGKKEEAIAAFKQVMAYYHPKHRNWRSARRRLKAMGQPVPPLPPRDPRPGESPPPSPSPEPKPSPSSK